MVDQCVWLTYFIQRPLELFQIHCLGQGHFVCKVAADSQWKKTK